MKICFVLDDSIYRVAGVQYAILNFSRWLVSQDHEVTVLYSEFKSVPKYDIDKRIKLIPIATGFDIKSLNLNGSVSPFPGFTQKKILKKFFDRNEIDVLHICYPFSPFVTGRVLSFLKKRKMRTLCALQIHVEEKLLPKISNYLFGLFMKRYVKFIDIFTHNATPTKEYGKKYLGIKSYFLPVGFEDIDISDKFNSNKNNVDILFLGRFEHRKGVLDFIKAVNQIKVDCKKSTFHVAGDGPLMQKARTLASEQKDKNFIFYGRVSDGKRDELYLKSDIAVFPAAYGEAMGNVLLEAMNYGCAVVGYANAGYADTMNKFKDECLVKPGDINALRDIIELRISDMQGTRLLAGKLKEYFKSVYSVTSVGQKLVGFYNNKISKDEQTVLKFVWEEKR